MLQVQTYFNRGKQFRVLRNPKLSETFQNFCVDLNYVLCSVGTLQTYLMLFHYSAKIASLKLVTIFRTKEYTKI